VEQRVLVAMVKSVSQSRVVAFVRVHCLDPAHSTFYYHHPAEGRRLS